MKKSDQILEEWLVINCQNGDRKSLELLVKRWNPKMLRRAYHTTGNVSAAQDIVQESWITIFNKLKALRDPRAFQGWSLRIVTTKAIDWVRANQLDRKREGIRVLAQTEQNETTAEFDNEIISELKKAVKELPADQFEIIQLFYQENLGISTIAQLLKLPVGTVKSRLFRGRETLKQQLENKSK